MLKPVLKRLYALWVFSLLIGRVWAGELFISSEHPCLGDAAFLCALKGKVGERQAEACFRSHRSELSFTCRDYLSFQGIKRDIYREFCHTLIQGHCEAELAPELPARALVRCVEERRLESHGECRTRIDTLKEAGRMETGER